VLISEKAAKYAATNCMGDKTTGITTTTVFVFMLRLIGSQLQLHEHP